MSNKTKTPEEVIKELKMLQSYRKKGIKIGMATDDGTPIDKAFILAEINKYRQLTKPGCATLTKIEIFDSPFAVTKKYPTCKFNNAYYGNHDIQWLIGGLCNKIEYEDARISESIFPLLALANKIGWFWMDNNKICVSRRPSKLVFKRKFYPNQKELQEKFEETSIMVGHNPDGMAIQYQDGTGVYILNGLRIPLKMQWLILDKERLTLNNILGIKNTEMRTEALKLLPISMFQEGMGFKVIHEADFPNGGHYELREILVDDVKRKYLKGTCPSKGEDFNEAVPPQCLTVMQALNWREEETDIDEVDVNTYISPVIRT